MALIFPVDCKTPAERTEYAYRCQELLRLRYNEMGQKFRDGKLSKVDWDNFQKNVSEPATNEVVRAIGKYREFLKQSKRWTIDIEVI